MMLFLVSQLLNRRRGALRWRRPGMGRGSPARVAASPSPIKRDYSSFFPACGPGLHSKTSVIFISTSDFAGSSGFFSWTIFFIFS